MLVDWIKLGLTCGVDVRVELLQVSNLTST